VLSTPKNNGMLRTALGNLKADHAEVVLYVLRRLLEADAIVGVPARRSKRPGTLLLPTLSQTWDWISLVLDVHFQRLVLRAKQNEGTKTLLQSLGSMCASSLDTCETMERVLVRLGAAVGGSGACGKSKSRAAKPSYSKEVVVMPI